MEFTLKYAQEQDEKYPNFRHLFEIPRVRDVTAKVHDPSLTATAAKTSSQTSAHDSHESDEEAVYLCGNSLGLMPKNTRKIINEELDVWASRFASIGVL